MIKKWSWAFIVIAVGLLGCRFGSGASTAAPIIQQPARTPTPGLVTPLVGPEDENSQGQNQEPPAAGTGQEIQPAPASDQEMLKNEWRPVFNGAKLLSASCEMMFDTWLQYQIEEITLVKAQEELNIESDYLAMAHQAFIELQAPGPTILPYKESLETDMGTLIVLLAKKEAADLNSLESTNSLLDTCSVLFDTLEEITNAAAFAGMSDESLQMLELETAGIIAELQSKIQAGR